MASATSTTLGVFGYLPGQPDFVRVRAAGREVRRLEDWLERGLHQARWEMGGAFSVAYPRLFHRFIYRLDNTEQVVAGVLCASVDCHQRPFPFVAFDLIPTGLWDRRPAGLVARNSEFFAALEQLLRTVGPLAHIGQVHGQVAATCAAFRLDDAQLSSDASSADDEARYQNFLHETCCGDLGGPSVSSGTALLHDLMALLGSEQDPRLLRHVLELSLSRPAFARDLELRFYLTFLETLLASRPPTVTLFWQLGGTAPGTLMLSFREPILDVFSALLGENRGSRGVYRPGTGPTPLLRPLSGLTDATPLYTLLEMSAPNPQQADARRRERNGKRS